MALRLGCHPLHNVTAPWRRFPYLMRISLYSSGENTTSHIHNCNRSEVTTFGSEQSNFWVNAKAGIFGPRDKRFQLPGEVGPDEQLDMYIRLFQKAAHSIKPRSKNSDLYKSSDFPMPMSSKDFLVSAVLRQPDSCLEWTMQECPKLLAEDFASLFPNWNLENEKLTVITWCQKTVNDMSAWSQSVEEEREKIIADYVTSAKKLCTKLVNLNHFADFIDPVSGRPHLGEYTPATLFETDERLRHFGFCIEDLGCCKVITHKQWGPHIFVGALFTTAPVTTAIEAWPYPFKVVSKA